MSDSMMMSIFGQGSKYEAEAWLIEGDGDWRTYLVFQSDALSPVEEITEGLPGTLKFKWIGPRSVSDAYAYTKLLDYYNSITNIFQSLRVL